MSKETMRKAARSGTMLCPVCKQKRALVEHHIHGREFKDYCELWNLCYICPSCHDDVHSGRLILEGWVATSEGKELAWHKAKEEPKYLESATPPLYTQKS